MDTKLKKFNDKISVRACAFVLCVLLLITSAISLSIMIQYTNGVDPFDRITSKGYEDSAAFKDDLSNALHAASTIYYYGSEDSIKKGARVDPDIEKYKVSRYYYDYIHNKLGNYYGDEEEGSIEIPDKELPYYQAITIEGKEVSGEEMSSVDPSDIDYYEVKPYDAGVRAQVLKDFGTEVDAYAQKRKNNEIRDQLEEFAQAKSDLSKFSYYVSDGKKMVTNMDGEITEATDVNSLATATTGQLVNKGYDCYYGTEGNYKTDSDAFYGTSVPEVFMDRSEYESEIEPGTLSVYIGFDDALWNTKASNYSDTRIAVITLLAIGMSTFVISMLILIYLVVVTGRKGADGKIKLYFSDKLFTEIQLFIILLSGIFFIGAAEVFGLFNEFRNPPSIPSIQVGTYVLLGLLWAVLVSVALWWFLSIIRMLKAHIFLSRSLVIIGVKTVYKWIKTLFNGANPMGKFVIIIVAGCILSMTIALAPVVIGLILGFGYKWVKKYTEIKKGVEEVNSGNLEYKIPVDDLANTEFDQLARQINSISMSSNIAIQNELKNQRLKTDLISNVSHDLKTPLTSIITYTDLLKKEGMNSPNAGNYLNVIDEKGQRLKALTEDLFEAAKASSGAVPVRLEKVDLLSLIKQGLVELDEGLSSKGLEVIVNAPNDKYYVNADSQLLWRVVENLLNNVEKYALENSRVYLDLTVKERAENKPEMILFEIKNMSKAPLNIPEDELMERFKRGDESRNTEGSGLGLAIAKDLVKLQNGWFELKIDGDLFKSMVMLEAYNADVIKQAQEEAAAEEKIHHIKEDDNRPNIVRDDGKPKII